MNIQHIVKFLNNNYRKILYFMDSQVKTGARDIFRNVLPTQSQHCTLRLEVTKCTPYRTVDCKGLFYLSKYHS